MRNVQLSLTLIVGVFSLMLLNSCSSSRSFDGYYPENRITGKGYGYNNVEQPAPTDDATLVQEEVVVMEEENNNAPTTDATSTTTSEEVVAEAPAANVPTIPTVDMSQLTPREIKWINKLGLNRMVDANAQPKKLNFFERFMMKAYSKMAMRQMEKYYGGTEVQRMSTADIFAIVSLSAGGFAWIAYYGFFLFAIAGIVFGVLALKRGTSRRGMAIAGIVLGAVALFFWLLLFGFVIGVGWF